MATKQEMQDEVQTRISFSLDPSTRRAIRIAAAVNDQEVGEWAVQVLERAANEQVKAARVG